MKKAIAFFTLLLILLTFAFYYPYRTDGKYSINNDLITEISHNSPNYTSINDIPDNLKNATIAIEDHRFYKHHGIDTIAVARALINDLKAWKIVEGGSTITQQLAKNLFLSNDKTLKRKFKELVFTIKLEQKYTKDQVLEMYLNVIYYGSNTYGASNASKKYFNKDIKNLSLSECAMLAGIPQAPNAYNPIKHYDKAKTRQEVVLNAMVKNRFIDDKKIKEYKKQLVFITPCIQ